MNRMDRIKSFSYLRYLRLSAANSALCYLCLCVEISKYVFTD
jgi:hypothetical protein